PRRWRRTRPCEGRCRSRSRRWWWQWCVRCSCAGRLLAGRLDDAAVAQRAEHLLDAPAVVRVPAVDEQVDLLAGGHRGGALQAGGDDRAGGVAAGEDGLEVLAGQEAVAEGAAEAVAGAEAVDHLDQ